MMNSDELLSNYYVFVTFSLVLCQLLFLQFASGTCTFSSPFDVSVLRIKMLIIDIYVGF